MNILKFVLSLVDPVENDKLVEFEKVPVRYEKRVFIIKPKLKVVYTK